MPSVESSVMFMPNKDCRKKNVCICESGWEVHGGGGGLTAAKEAGRKIMVRYEICFIAVLSRTVASVSLLMSLLSWMLILWKTYHMTSPLSGSFSVVKETTHKVLNISQPLPMHLTRRLHPLDLLQNIIALFLQHPIAVLPVRGITIWVVERGVRRVHDEGDRFLEVGEEGGVVEDMGGHDM